MVLRVLLWSTQFVPGALYTSRVVLRGKGRVSVF